MTHRPRFLLFPVLGLAFAALLHPGGGPAPALAGQVRSDAPIVLAQDDPDAQQDPSSAAALLVRVDRLENKLRSMTGQIEQLQFQNKRLEDALRKMQQDVDFRFQDLNRAPITPGGKPPLQRRGDLGEAAPDAVADTAPAASEAVPGAVASATPAPAVATPQRRGDAFDPASDPSAPGAPKPLGSAASAAPALRPSMPTTATPAPGVRTSAGSAAPAELHAPLDLTHGLNGAPPAAVASATPEAPEAAPVPPPSGGTASLSPGSTRAEYEADYALYKAAQYDGAITGFNDFLTKYPRDRLVPDATYFLGESFAKLGRHREAAEQFLKLSTDYTKSNRAPDALLRLGIALNALGASAQACATYQEVDRKYPAAGADVRTGVDRELKRAHC
ncbi:MAG: tol-pal system protein YbgF [Janthinobacterium lividum]